MCQYNLKLLKSTLNETINQSRENFSQQLFYIVFIEIWKLRKNLIMDFDDEFSHRIFFIIFWRW